MMALTMILQASGMAPAYPVPPAITPASRTAPIVDAACKISDPEGQQFALSIRQSGGRGYRATRNGSTYFPRTPIKQDIVRDSAGIFDGFEFTQNPRETWPGSVEALKIPGQFIRIDTISTERDDKFVILIRRQWPRASVHYIGFCDVKKTSQAPLDVTETEEANRQ